MSVLFPKTLRPPSHQGRGTYHWYGGVAGFSSEGPVTLPVILFNSGSELWRSPVAMALLQQAQLNLGWWQQSSLEDSAAHTPGTTPAAGQSSAHKRFIGKWWDQLNTRIHSFLSILSLNRFSLPRHLFKQNLKGKTWYLGRNSSSSVRSSRTFSTLANVLTRIGAVP